MMCFFLLFFLISKCDSAASVEAKGNNLLVLLYEPLLSRCSVTLDRELKELGGFSSADFSVPKVGTQLLTGESRTNVSKQVTVEQTEKGVCGGLALAGGPARRALSPSSAGPGRGRGGKAPGSGQRQGDLVSVTAVGKTGSTWGKQSYCQSK